MFALESLAIAGENYANSERVRQACQFLVRHQMDDGGWGETYMVRLPRLWFLLTAHLTLPSLASPVNMFSTSDRRWL